MVSLTDAQTADRLRPSSGASENEADETSKRDMVKREDAMSAHVSPLAGPKHAKDTNTELNSHHSRPAPCNGPQKRVHKL